MSSDTRLTSDEKRAFRGLRNITKVAYILCFREVMDFATCITGLTRRINWRAVWETIEEEPDWGANWKPDELTTAKKQALVKSISKEAIRAGLLVPVYKKGKKLPMVFECPLAYRGSVSKKGTPNERRVERLDEKNNYTEELKSYSEEETEERRTDPERNAPHLVSGLLNTKVFNNNTNGNVEENLPVDNSHEEAEEKLQPALNSKPATNKKSKPKRKDDTELITRIFEHWKTTMNHPRAKLDDKRKRDIRKGLKLNFTEDELKQAITGCSKSAFHMGQNDRNEVYDGLGLIFRNADKIENFIAQADKLVLSNLATGGMKHGLQRTESNYERIMRQGVEFYERNEPLF